MSTCTKDIHVVHNLNPTCDCGMTKSSFTFEDDKITIKTLQKSAPNTWMCTSVAYGIFYKYRKPNDPIMGPSDNELSDFYKWMGIL